MWNDVVNQISRPCHPSSLTFGAERILNKKCLRCFSPPWAVYPLTFLSLIPLLIILSLDLLPMFIAFTCIYQPGTPRIGTRLFRLKWTH